MRRVSFRSPLSAVLLLFLIVGCVHTQSSLDSRNTLPDISRAEFKQLRPVVFNDLKALIARVENEPSPTPKNIEEEFLRCKFTPLQLGTLGRAILVEGEPGHGATNATMLNIYLPEHGSYRLILQAGGFGPRATGDSSIPDLVFGWASGVCHAKYYRYTFKKSQYDTAACDQESEGAPPSPDDCAIHSCGGGHLPTFPSPWPEEPDQAKQSAHTLIVGKSSTGKQILSDLPR